MDSLKEYFCIEITFFSHFYMGLDRRKNLFHLLILRNIIFLPKKAFIALKHAWLKITVQAALKLFKVTILGKLRLAIQVRYSALAE